MLRPHHGGAALGRELREVGVMAVPCRPGRGWEDCSVGAGGAESTHGSAGSVGWPSGGHHGMEEEAGGLVVSEGNGMTQSFLRALLSSEPGYHVWAGLGKPWRRRGGP